MSHMLQSSELKASKNRIKFELIKYKKHENETWEYLYQTQRQNLTDIAHSKLLSYIDELNFPKNEIPQLHDVSKTLYNKSGWQILRVEDLINATEFFGLLSDRIFPSTVYIRTSSELVLSRDPDIFHELFGHCPILLDKNNAKLFQKFGKLGIQLDELQQKFLQRLFWFSYETGLIQEKDDLKIYGGSLMSSIEESRYAVESNTVPRKEFNILDVFRTPYRADIVQGIYFIIDNFKQLYRILEDPDHVKRSMEKAYNLGEFPPLFPLGEEFQKYINQNICKSLLEAS